jgi:CRISPR-associated endonuclease/helicase Cas3
LFEELLAGRFPDRCDIPTGLGKTSVIGIWLLALAGRTQAGGLDGFPRRLVYVVNRRTVVDQSTRQAEQMREALAAPELAHVAEALHSLASQRWSAPVAISTLRGQFADNAEWRIDPARPAVIAGTVDMIGSRLLFNGYGCGFKSRPLHAGFLGQDTLLVHDEAHLEPAFQELIDSIEAEQRRCSETRGLRVMALTATARTDRSAFALTKADCEHDEVRRRIAARKGLAFEVVEGEKQIPDGVTERALAYSESGQAILVYLFRLDHAEKVVEGIRRAKQKVQMLTGTLRGFERDRLATEDPIFARFLPRPGISPEDGTVFLVCTSAGEVGVDISADHLVCDLTPFDSMAQRLGRVNRFGVGDAKVDVVCAPFRVEPQKGATNTKTDPDRERARALTRALLERLPRRDDSRLDACPRALGELPAADRLAAFTPAPPILPLTDILLDRWSLTTIRDRLPGRPPVADWLHGVEPWEPPQTVVAWREEVGLLVGNLVQHHDPADLLEEYPLKPHELIREQTKRVVEQLAAATARCSSMPVWVIDHDQSVAVATLGEVAASEDLAGMTVLLPPAAGGLRKSGLLDGGAPFDEAIRYDVSDEWHDESRRHRRLRLWDDELPPGMRLVRTIDTLAAAADDDEDAGGRRYWRWYVRPRSADDDGSRTANAPQELGEHLDSARRFAAALVAKLRLPTGEAKAVELAAGWHDRGKGRTLWQRSIGNRDYPALALAKSGGKAMTGDLRNYRHELGTVLDVSVDARFRELAPAVQDLVLHLIAAHHGRARPHFDEEEAFDPERPDDAVAAALRGVPRRFARLQRRYGRWGLAFLESLVRASDILASQPQDATEATS